MIKVNLISDLVINHHQKASLLELQRSESELDKEISQGILIGSEHEESYTQELLFLRHLIKKMTDTKSTH